MAQMKMLSTLFALLLSSSVSAQEATKDEPVRIPGLTKYEITRYVVSGKKQTIEFVYGAYPDCSPLEWIEIRKVKEPEHGTVEIAPGEHFNNDRTKCGNGKKIRGQTVSYKSSGGYTGPDAFDLLVLYPSGTAREMHFIMNVR